MIWWFDMTFFLKHLFCEWNLCYFFCMIHQTRHLDTLIHIHKAEAVVENFQDHLSWHRVSDANRLYFTKIPMMCRTPDAVISRPNEVPAPNRSTAEQRPMSGPFSSESRRGNGKRLSSWNDPVGVHGVSPYTFANRSFKEAVPQKTVR